MIFKVNTIQDIQGKKTVLSSEGLKPQVYFYGKFYDFDREINQVKNIEVFTIEADGFNHAIDKINHKKKLKTEQTIKDNLRKKIEMYENKILKSRKLRLYGKKRESKLNSFLR